MKVALMKVTGIAGRFHDEVGIVIYALPEILLRQASV